jgi:hypothetical protein
MFLVPTFRGAQALAHPPAASAALGSLAQLSLAGLSARPRTVHPCILRLPTRQLVRRELVDSVQCRRWRTGCCVARCFARPRLPVRRGLGIGAVQCRVRRRWHGRYPARRPQRALSQCGTAPRRRTASEPSATAYHAAYVDAMQGAKCKGQKAVLSAGASLAAAELPEPQHGINTKLIMLAARTSLKRASSLRPVVVVRQAQLLPADRLVPPNPGHCVGHSEEMFRSPLHGGARAPAGAQLSLCAKPS